MKISNESKIGVMVVLVLVTLAYLTIKTGNYDFTPNRYELKVHFYNIDGVDQNAPVRLNGLEIGRVKDIKVLYGDDEKMELTLLIDDGTKIREGSEAYVKNMGLLGEKYIGLTIGEPGKDYLGPGAIIIGQEPGNFDKMMGDGQVLAENLKEMSVQMNEHLKKNKENIDEILANLRIVSKNLASITDNVDERLAVNKHLIDDTMMHVNSATRNFDEMSYDLKLNPWKLMYKERAKRTDTAVDNTQKK